MFNTTTTVYVEATKASCTSNRFPVTATIYTNPVVNLGPPLIVIGQGQTITLDAGNGFASYLWNTTATSQTINVNTTGLYKVVVTDTHNCQGTDSITVTVSIGINETLLDAVLEVYPNPTQGLINVIMNDASLNFVLNITDVEGRIIMTDTHKFSGIFNKTYDLSELAKGIYYLRIFSSEGNVTRTLIIQ